MSAAPAALRIFAFARAAHSSARWVLPEPSGPTSARQPSCHAGQSSSAFRASRFVSEQTKSARAYDTGRLNFKRSWRDKGPNLADEVMVGNLALLQRSVDWPAVDYRQ